MDKEYKDYVHPEAKQKEVIKMLLLHVELKLAAGCEKQHPTRAKHLGQENVLPVCFGTLLPK